MDLVSGWGANPEMRRGPSGWSPACFPKVKRIDMVLEISGCLRNPSIGRFLAHRMISSAHRTIILLSAEACGPNRWERRRSDKIILPGPDHPILEGKMAFDNRSGIGIGPTAFSVGCCRSGGLAHWTAFARR